MADFITSTIRGRLGRYTLTIERVNLGSGEEAPTAITPLISQINPIRFGEEKIGWPSAPIYPSFTEITFIDPTGAIRDAFTDADFQELDYPVTITGPDFLWQGSAKRGLVGRPVASTVYTPLTSIFIYDRLAALKDLAGIPTIGIDLLDIIRNLFKDINPRAEIISSQDLRVTNAFTNSYALSQRQFDAQLVGEGRGDYGNGFDQMVRFCESHGLLLFMNTRTGNFDLVSRAILGTGQDFSETTQIIVDADGAASEISGPSIFRTAYLETLTASGLRGKKRDEYIRHAGLQAIIIENAGAINWVVDGDFLTYTGPDGSPDFTYWTETGTVFKLTGTTRAATTTAGGYTAQILGNFTAETDVRIRLLFIFVRQVRTRIKLNAFSGAEYWLDAAGAWQTSFQEKTQNSSVLTSGIHTALQDFPESGELVIEIGSEGGTITPSWGQVEAFLVDDTGAFIDDWTFRVGGEGETIVLQSVPGLLAEIDGIGTTAEAEIESHLSGIAVGSLNAYMAGDRLRQDLPTMDNLRGAIFRVVGPETVLSIVKDTGELSTFVMNGCRTDLLKGLTSGVWLETPDLRAGSGFAS